MSEAMKKGITAWITSAPAEEVILRIAALENFFRFTVWGGRTGSWGAEVPGDDLIDKAEELGLIRQREFDAPCCDECACADLHGEDAFPLTCYEYTAGPEPYDPEDDPVMETHLALKLAGLL